jgi:hypothetical protein
MLPTNVFHTSAEFESLQALYRLADPPGKQQFSRWYWAPGAALALSSPVGPSVCGGEEPGGEMYGVLLCRYQASFLWG